MLVGNIVRSRRESEDGKKKKAFNNNSPHTFARDSQKTHHSQWHMWLWTTYTITPYTIEFKRSSRWKNNQVSYRSRTHCKSLHVLRSYSHSMFQKLYINRMINTKAWTRYIKRIRTMSSLIIPPHVLFPTIQSLSQITHTETLPLFRICTAETITK